MHDLELASLDRSQRQGATRRADETRERRTQDAVYLNTRGVSFAVLRSGPWEEVPPCLQFMGYNQPWYSVRSVEAPIGGDMGHIVCFLRDGDRVFLTYSKPGRGNEPVRPAVDPRRRNPRRRPRIQNAPSDRGADR